jgi:His/Glu/Gln/Arg/opine family amino acid ABC transporter permease subunit
MRAPDLERQIYVAPVEPPPARRPPVTSVGALGWLRANLFSSWANSLATLVTGALLLWFLGTFVAWAVTSAQWSVVTNNLRLITSGLYPRAEIWRVELTAALLVFLTGLGLGIWGRVARSAWIAVLVALAAIVIVPVLAANIPVPPVHILIEPQRSPSSLVFVGAAGDEVRVALDPLTDDADMAVRQLGYVESQSRTAWSTQARAVQTGQLDLSNYNLSLRVRVLDASLSPLSASGNPATIVSTPEAESGSLAVTLPRDGWYVIEVQRDDEDRDNNAGYAWLHVEGVEMFPSLEVVRSGRAAELGPPPDVERPLYTEERAYRFEGTRDFPEFVSLQVRPFLRTISAEAFIGFGLFANGWIIGSLGRREKTVRRAAIAGWILAGPAILIILYGVQGSRTLPVVPGSVWGGLLLTILLTFVGITASFPLGVALALGRRSDLPVIKWTCTLFIEVIRGVPLITILFMAKLIVPFFWSGLSNIDLTVRMMIGLTLFSAAYLAENVRGGLQIVPHGQIEAARALGMNPLLTTSLIVLPQALRAVIPAIVGQFISLFKDTSLVAVVGLFELVGIVDTIVSGQPIYRPYQREAYIFVAIIYFVISYAMSDVSRRLETSGAGSVRR